MSTSTSLHTFTIVGAGAVGSGTARLLAQAGHTVRVVTRSGSGPEHANIERIAADATDIARLTDIATGSHALYNCANPPYDKWDDAWPPLSAAFLAAAEATGARLVTMSNLYGYAPGSSVDAPMRATDPLDPPSKKGAIRVGMWEDALAAHEAGRVRVTEARASDYVGPGLGDTAHLGDRCVPRVIAGKSVALVGDLDAPHSWSYIDDVCATLVVLGTDDRALGRAWHVPTLPAKSSREMVAVMADAAGVTTPKIRSIPRLAIRAVGLVVPVMREIVEMLYQFEAPFIMDGTETTEVFGLQPTPLAAQMAATVGAGANAAADLTAVSV